MNHNKSKKLVIAFKIISFIAFFAIIALTILYFIESSNGSMSFFTKHFAIGIDLLLVGIIAMMLPMINQRSFQGENKGDLMMTFVGIALILLSILTIGLSFAF